MSTPVTFNGVVYSIPAYQDIGYAQGTGNLSSYLIALAGGPYPFISQTVNPASTGTIRLAHSDTIDWRNQTNSGDLALGVNASDQLTFQGNTFVTSPVSVSNGGTGDTSLSAYSVLTGGTTSTNPVQTVSGTGLSGQALVSNGPATLPTWQNVAGSGTVNSGTAGHLSYYATSTNAVSDASGHTLSGSYNFSSLLSALAFQAHSAVGTFLSIDGFSNGGAFLFNAVGNPSVSRTFNFQDPGVDTTLVTTDGTQVIGGSKTFTTLLQTFGIDMRTQSAIEFDDATATGNVNVSAPNTIPTPYNLFLPTAQGTANTVLTNDGSGNLSWQFSFPLVAADPGSPVEGQVWYNTTTHLWKGFNGTTVRTFTTT